MRWRDMATDNWTYLTTRGEEATVTGVGAGRTFEWQVRAVSALDNSSEWVDGPDVLIQAYQGHVTVFFGASEPVGITALPVAERDLWFESDDTDDLHIYSAGAWTDISTGTNVDGRRFGLGDSASTGRGHTVVFYSPSLTPPTNDFLPWGNLLVGYLWAETDRPGFINRWNGSAWVPYFLGGSTTPVTGGGGGVGYERAFALATRTFDPANPLGQPSNSWGLPEPRFC